MKTNRIYVLDPGVREQLSASLTNALENHTKEWAREVNEDGEISDETCDVFVAIGWLPSKRDPRLTVKESAG